MKRQGKPAASQVSTTRLASALVAAVLVLAVMAAVAAVHWPALYAQALAFDDSQYLTENRLVRNPSWQSAWRFLSEALEPSTVGGYYQPLTMISLMVDDALGGRPDDLHAFHRTSLALHVANSALVVVLLYLLFGRPWPAAVVGLLFGLHPMTVEPIPWVGERKTLLAAFFALSSLIFYVRYARKSGWKAYVACLLLYVLALMSKPTSTPLPLAFLLLDAWPLGRLTVHPKTRVAPASRRCDSRVLGCTLNWHILTEKLPLFAIGAVFAVITVVSQGRTAHITMPSEYPPSRIPLVLCHNIVFYPLTMAWPANLSPHYPFPDPLILSAPMILAGVVGTCVLIPALVLSLRWTRAFLVGWLIFFVLLLPTTGIIGFTIVIASDKYAYLPAVGLLMVLAWLLGNLWARPPARTRSAVVRACILVLALLAAGAESVATYRQIARWQDTEGLYRYMLTLAPRSARLHTILGEILADQKRPDEAIAEHRLALQLKPDFAEAYNNLGIVLADSKGNFQDATKCFEQSLRYWPDNPRAHSNLAIALAIQGKLPDAVSHYERSLRLMPRSSETHNNLATTLLKLGKASEAMQHYQEAIRLDPDNAEARSNYGYALEMQGNRDQAARQYREALKIAPNNLQAQQGLQRLLDAKGAGSGPRSGPS